MKHTLRILLLGAAVLPLLVIGTPAHAAMSGSQIKAAASGKSFSYSGAKSGTLGWGSNGSAWLKPSGGKKLSGKWWVSGNNFCRQWKGKGKSCGSWTSLGGGKIRTSNGYTLTPR